MPRGRIVLDENLYALKPGLEKENFRVEMVNAGEDDELDIIPRLDKDIFVTNNPADFREAAAEGEFSIIDTKRTFKDTQYLVKQISKTLANQKLGLRGRMPFIVTLYRNKPPKVESTKSLPKKASAEGPLGQLKHHDLEPVPEAPAQPKPAPPQQEPQPKPEPVAPKPVVAPLTPEALYEQTKDIAVKFCDARTEQERKELSDDFWNVLLS
jgi:hypothetical protein